MKKFLVIGLALFATGVMAQPHHHHHNPAVGGNEANIYQSGMFQIGIIKQTGADNKATVDQSTWGFFNLGIIKQLGIGNDATVKQVGWFNYAWLNQFGHNATGTINQHGMGNYAYVLQLSNSELLINQTGKGNTVFGASEYGVSFCNPQFDYPDFSCYNPYIRGKMPLLVGKGKTIHLDQNGNGEHFFGIGELEGTRTITQGGYKDNDNSSFRRHHHHLDNNYIWLEQKTGNVNLEQYGSENKIWLAVLKPYGHYHNVTQPEVNIVQEGKANKVAHFKNACPTCQYRNVDGPAVFVGAKLDISQNGYGNVASIEGLSVNSTITIEQTGVMNSAYVVQHDFGHHMYSTPNCASCN